MWLEHELITGLRQEGIFFLGFVFNKMTSGIGTVAGLCACADRLADGAMCKQLPTSGRNHCLVGFNLRTDRFEPPWYACIAIPNTVKPSTARGYCG